MDKIDLTIRKDFTDNNPRVKFEDENTYNRPASDLLYGFLEKKRKFRFIDEIFERNISFREISIIEDRNSGDDIYEGMERILNSFFDRTQDPYIQIYFDGSRCDCCGKGINILNSSMRYALCDTCDERLEEDVDGDRFEF